MTLQEWVRQDNEAHGEGGITRLQERTRSPERPKGLHYTTVHKAVRENKAASMDAARILSAATGGEVSVAEAFGMSAEDRGIDAA